MRMSNVYQSKFKSRWIAYFHEERWLWQTMTLAFSFASAKHERTIFFLFFSFSQKCWLSRTGERADFSQCVRDDLRVFSFHAPPMPGFSPCFIIVAVIDFFFLLLFFFFYFTLVLRLPWDCTRSRPDTLTGSRWRLPCRSWSPFAKERYDRRRLRYTASISRVLTQRSTIRFQTLSNLQERYAV